MSKRIKYVISSLLAAFGFYFFISLPYESHYYGLLVGIVLIVFCFWFGLGVIFEPKFYVRLMSIVLPVSFYIGFALFVALIPQTFILTALFSIFFGLICYGIFLVENVFLVAIGFRTPPLYRAAYTVGLMIMLMSAFFLFNSLFSFKFIYWLNAIIVLLLSCLLFLYLFFSVTIELPDDGKDKSIVAYVLVPSILMAELAFVLSFLPVGIFKGSMYLVVFCYVLSGLLHAELRERLFKRTWINFVWIGIAFLLAMLVTISWR